MLNSQALKIIKKGNLEYIQFPKLLNTGVARHLFSTRHGGVSTGDCYSMNLSFNRGEPFDTVMENYKIICGAENIDINNLVLSHQTHTNNVISVTKEHCGTGITKPSFCDVDGMITNQSGIALVTQYADCTPLLFCDPKRRVIASSHAGWRGTSKLIAKVTVDKMVSEYGCLPNDIIVGIGPCILDCCYEVDYAVYSQFENYSFLDLPKIFKAKENAKYMMNLVEANKQILIHSGILPENIDLNDICTCCNSDDLHSHRATMGKRGNLAAIIELI